MFMMMTGEHVKTITSHEHLGDRIGDMHPYTEVHCKCYATQK